MDRSRILLVALGAVALGGCGETRDAIDRTQPNKVSKAQLEGEWYYQQTVVDIPGTWSFTFVGETNWAGMERIRWDVQENWLYARRSYEKIKDAEGPAADVPDDGTGRPYYGAILAAYPITSHFDVKHAYNPSTGEALNVIEENTTDRPWYDRDYLRVDWSTNHASNFQFMVDDVRQDPVAYYVQDENDPDYPVFDGGEFDAQGVMLRQPYIDVTNVMMVQPGMTYFEELGESYPTCWLLNRVTADCTTEPVKIRNSFQRIDPARQYVPKKFKGAVTDYFGLFTTDRLVYDPEQEVSEKFRERYANLHNLWKQWKAPDGRLLAPSEREVRPMVYYTHNWPVELDATLRTVESNWNGIFQRAVAAARGQDAYDGQVFTVCHVPFSAERGDNLDLCVPPEHRADPSQFKVRIGDLRYSWIAYVDKYYDGFALLGLGPSNSDPLTGEIISAGAYLYVYNDIVAQTTAEMVQLLNGDMNPYQYVDGLDLTDWVNQSRQMGNTKETWSDADKRALVANMDFSWTKGLAKPTAEQLATLDGKPVREVLKQVAPYLHDQGWYDGSRDDSGGRLGSLKDSYLEDMLLNPEMQLAAGIMPGSSRASLTDEMLRRSSIARLGPIKVMKALRDKKEYFARVRNVDLADTVDDGYWGMAQRYKGMEIDEVRAGLREDIYQAVLTHELGHSFNLHHNMGGTEDVVNYHDEYWQIRSNPDAGDGGVVGPRWTDPISDYELESEIYKYAYSSIMDYSRLGLDGPPGKYDAAAILLGYGGKVESFLNTGGVEDEIFQQWSEYDGDVSLFYTSGPVSWHYTQWWQSMGNNLWRSQNRALVDEEDVNWRTGAAGSRRRVPYIFCSPYQSDIGNNCLTRDFGADPYERIQHHVQGANTWYVTRAFSRYKVGATPEDYVGRTYDRLYSRLKGYNDSYALISGLLYTYYPKQQIDDFLVDDLNGWGSYTIAEGKLLNFLLSTIATPTIGNFGATTDPTGMPYMGPDAFGTGALNVNLTMGRYFTTSWQTSAFDCGMYWFECLNHYGFYMDKIMAMEALTDAETNFVGRDTAEDIREWRISFYDNYRPVLQKFFGDLLAQDYPAFAPRYDSTATLGSPERFRFPNYAGGLTHSNGTAVDPSAGFTVQLYAAVLGMARMQNNFDKSFLDAGRMWIRGSAFSIDVAAPAEYTDPLSGKVYQAMNLAGPQGIARRMIERANTLYLRSEYCTGDTCVATTLDEKVAVRREMERYTQLLDVMVDLTGYYETFTQNYGNPYDPGSLP
jgi:hypothetical protein